MNMPFGKHKGKEIDRLPTGYLRWLLGQSDVQWAVVSECKAVLARRQERFLSADMVLADLEETLTLLVSDDPTLDHEIAGTVSDHVLTAFDEVRQRYHIGRNTELVVPPDQRQGAIARRIGGMP